ncbi:hypothetical protein R84981_002337 [Carnimonas sp. R-84981]
MLLVASYWGARIQAAEGLWHRFTRMVITLYHSIAGQVLIIVGIARSDRGNCR